jgi:hypothetical protein
MAIKLFLASFDEIQKQLIESTFTGIENRGSFHVPIIEVDIMDAKKLITAIENADFEARSYSGRGMYGDKCVGVTINGGMSSFRLGAAIAYALVESSNSDDPSSDVEELTRLRVCEDSMGHGAIVYFPGVKWPENDNEDEVSEDGD